MARQNGIVDHAPMRVARAELSRTPYRHTHAGRLFDRPRYNPTMRTLIALMLFATTLVVAGWDCWPLGEPIHTHS